MESGRGVGPWGQVMGLGRGVGPWSQVVGQAVGSGRGFKSWGGVGSDESRMDERIAGSGSGWGLQWVGVANG